MITCPHCGRTVDPNESPDSRNWKIAFKIFKSATASWEALFQQAADFASGLGPQELVSICHSEDSNEGVVTVWYWKWTGSDEITTR
jgi:hypothetical protein